jgi:peptide methionine sulfoxide reductase msrA/msrB
MEKEYKKLTPEEEDVIVGKRTERPFSGKYNANDEEGVYSCKRCGSSLYRSEDKFDSGCGWPSFDDEIPGAVKRLPDPDGKRTEIVCSGCGAHLGHVFEGERQTAKDMRHCVNSISLEFRKKKDVHEAYFAGGCFWGVEYCLKDLDGVLGTRVGYMGGESVEPSYEQVCAGGTGHAETVEVVYDESVTDYETLTKAFFELHDPTQKDRQGPDVGTQYRSTVFYTDEEQRMVAEDLIAQLESKGIHAVTTIQPAGRFYPAEEYHQRHYEKGAGTPYCHVRRKIF